MKTQHQSRRRSLVRGAGAFALGLVLMGGAAGRAQNSGDKIALTVNGEIVTEVEYFDRMQRLRAQDFIVTLTPLQVISDTAGQLTVNRLINERLIMQWAVKTNQMPSDAEVESEIENLKKLPDVAKALEAKTVTEELLRYSVRVERARFNIATTAASVSPQEVEAFYKARIADFTTPERWSLAIIRTAKPGDLPKIQAELKAGKPFADVAKTYSDDERTKNQGGQLPVLSAKNNTLPPIIRDAAKTLKTGETSAPLKIETEQGMGKPRLALWFFLRMTNKEPEKVRPFAEVKTQCERLALLERAGGYATADKKIADYRKQSQIKVSLPGYESLSTPPKTE